MRLPALSMLGEVKFTIRGAGPAAGLAVNWTVGILRAITLIVKFVVV